MNSDLWVVVIQTFGVIVSSSGVTAIVVKLVNSRKQREQNLFIDAIESMHEIYNCLNDVISQNGCSRAVVLYSENGGGIPQGRSDLFVTISHEMHMEAESVRHKVQKLPVDYDYIQMLNALLGSDHGCIFLETEKMNPGLLKDLYQYSETSQALVFKLTQTKNKLYYCSFNFKKEHPVTDQCFRNCTLQASKIRMIIKNDQKRLRKLFYRK